MIVLVIGATGNTGKWVVRKLLQQNIKVKALLRDSSKIENDLQSNPNLWVNEIDWLSADPDELKKLISDCQVVISCLGHSPTLRGIFGNPKKLVTQSVQKFGKTIIKTNAKIPVRFILMNTAGNSNRNIIEPISFLQKTVVSLLRHLLPPHADNEKAADYLRIQFPNENKQLEWVVVRPDTLIDETFTSPYEVYPSPVYSALFESGKTSRINVADFMCRLVTDSTLWNNWQGQMPVIYNSKNKS